MSRDNSLPLSSAISDGQSDNYYDTPDLVLVKEIKDEVIDGVNTNLDVIEPDDNLLKAKGHLSNCLPAASPAVRGTANCVKIEVIENENLLEQHNIMQENVDIKLEGSKVSEVQENNEDIYTFVKSEGVYIKREEVRKSPSEIFKDGLTEQPPHHKNPEETIPFKCDKCDFETVRLNSMRQHRLRHKLNKVHQCSQCNFKSLGKAYLNRHILSDHGSKGAKIYQCPFCNYKSLSNHNYKNHIKYRHTSIEDIEVYKCPDCEFQTKYKHCFRDHSLWHKDPEELMWFKCTKCDYESLYKSNIKVHSLSHLKRKRRDLYKCEQCEFKAEYKSLFKAHMIRHKSVTTP